MSYIKRITLIITLMSLAGCAGLVPPVKDVSKFTAASPRSILIVPVVNQSMDVTAPDYFLSTISVPVANQGYYVFPVNLVKRLLEDDGLSDADLVHNAPASKLCQLFGADAVLYVSVNRWDAKYLVATTQVTVELNYMIKDGKTDEVLWADHEGLVYTSDTADTGNPMFDLAYQLISAAITKAAPNYLPLAHQANASAFMYPGDGIPAGPYAITEAPKK